MNALDEPQTLNTEPLNTLLLGEMSAVETYTRAMEKFDDELVIAELQKIRDEHSRAVRELRDHMVELGATPPTRSEPWGEFVSAVADDAEVTGPATALAALRLGEEHGATEYEAALENPDVPLECHGAIRRDLLAASRKHVEELNRLLGGMNH